MYKRILVPVDGSATSTAGLQQALRFARDKKAKLRIIHIVDEAVLADGVVNAALGLVVRFVK